MEIITHNPLSMAWVGDAIFTLAVRKHIVDQGFQKPGQLDRMQKKFNSAYAQSAILERLEEEDWFSDDEKDILRRGRNANSNTKAKNTDGRTYSRSTAFEALLGYLYLYHHEKRLEELIRHAIEIGESL